MKTCLLFTKKTYWCEVITRWCESHFEVDYINTGQHYDFIISFLSPIIIPKTTLEQGDICINFHPGPPKYPGIGCYNFALYYGDKWYGVVCHEMEEKVDTGRIWVQKKFPISPNETVESLKEKSMVYLTALFFEVMGNLMNDIFYKHSSIPWENNPFTHKDLQNLVKNCVCIDMNEVDCFDRWYTACYYPGAKDRPYLEYKGKKYYIVREDHVNDRSDVSWNYTTY